MLPFMMMRIATYPANTQDMNGKHCVNSVRIRSYSCPHSSRIFPASSISPYSVCMREDAGKMWTRVTPNTDTFYAVKYQKSYEKNCKIKIIFNENCA